MNPIGRHQTIIGVKRTTVSLAALKSDKSERKLWSALAIGIAAAFVATYRMERACAMQLAFQQSGAAFYPIADEAVTAAYSRPTGARNDPAKFEWPALLRKLDRIDPSYKQ
jgi:hypothetical protein